ncbi:hypothetical protein ASD02_25310 [Ensifer sp. Root1252]|nr:hypothetical protein ASD02_25310 [Ensifer sp. Root1252]KRC79346.1 hypothetical protein ASE32_25850 [Ensifer sp. Root231]KRC99738.1 hypothetical protein ASE47_26210 [Ensifer sp. Root258]
MFERAPSEVRTNTGGKRGRVDDAGDVPVAEAVWYRVFPVRRRGRSGAMRLPRARPLRARSAAVFVQQIRPSSAKRAKSLQRLSMSSMDEAAVSFVSCR